MSEYIYNLPTSFSEGFDKKHLIFELKQQFLKFSKISVYGDTLKVLFDQSLTEGEESSLTSLISSHDSTPNTPREKFYSVNPHTTQTKNTSWTTMCTFEFPGRFHVGSINYINIISRIQTSNTNYDIRVTDMNNSNILAQLDNKTNTSFQSIDLGTISNIPDEPTLLEIQVKASSKKWVYLSQAIIYYGNEIF